MSRELNTFIQKIGGLFLLGVSFCVFWMSYVVSHVHVHVPGLAFEA